MEKRTHIQFRSTKYEKKLLKVKAKRAGLSLSEYCRRCAMGHNIITRLTDEEVEIYKMLVKYAHNFKLIGNMFKKRDTKLSKEVIKLSNEIKDHLKKFKK